MTTLLNAPRRGTRAARHTRVDSLDGLRAVAVLLVLAYHVSVPGATGGFLGVDIFFVLSGFLITTLLMREITGKGRIDLGGFWLRRVLRLIPALVFVVLTVVGVSAFAAPPYRRADIGADAFWSLLYVGNWRFIASSGYFSNDGSTSPLQHVWSLAVEEQFYIVWPLMLLVIVVPLVRRTVRMRDPLLPEDSASRTEAVARRRAAARRWVLVLAGTATVASAVWFAVLYDPQAPDRAYMGTDTRAYAPLTGAVAAALMQYRSVQLLVTRRAQAIMGVGMVALAVGVVVLGGPDAPIPAYFLGGGVAFAAVAATVIAATSAADRREGLALILGSTPLGYLGRISYGMYLWHWPLVVWIIGDRGWEPWRALVVLVLTILAADISFRLVESPFRKGSLRKASPGRLLPATGGALCVATLVAAALGGTPWNPVVPAVAGQKSTGDAMVVVGDSVIQRLLPALDAEGRERGLTVVSGARGGCPALPIVATDRTGEALASGNCRSQVANRQNDALASVDPGVVVWWSRYEIADRSSDEGTLLQAGTPEFWRAQERDLNATVDRLTADGARLVIVEMDRPGVGIDSRCTPTECADILDRLRNRDDLRREWNAILQRLAAEDPRVTTIRMDDLFCRNEDTPCDDRLPLATAGGTFPPPSTDLARPDGSHFAEAAESEVASALLDRATAAAWAP